MVGRSAHSVFLQQGDDPIVWWDWDTLVDRPGLGRSRWTQPVNPAISWTPVTTFPQLAVSTWR